MASPIFLPKTFLGLSPFLSSVSISWVMFLSRASRQRVAIPLGLFDFLPPSIARFLLLSNPLLLLGISLSAFMCYELCFVKVFYRSGPSISSSVCFLSDCFFSGLSHEGVGSL